jgi:hypothetical protein
VMTVGGLSWCTGVLVKTLREYEDMGLIYTVGRSAGNDRLFDEEALWCVGLIGTLPGLGLTLAGDPRGSPRSIFGSPEGPSGRGWPSRCGHWGRSAASSSAPHRTNAPASMRGWRGAPSDPAF